MAELCLLHWELDWIPDIFRLMSSFSRHLTEWEYCRQVVLETSFVGAFASDIYIYKWECNYNVTKSFCLSLTFPSCNSFLLRHNGR